MVVAAMLSSLSLASCRADDEYDLPDDIVWETRHFAYHTRRSDGSVCEGIVAKLEEHFSAFQEVLGIDWPDGRTIHYYKFITPEDLVAHSPCSAGSAACTDRNHVW
jgi:Ser/Thr protein kinase RdoA (MazF antagonist)